MITSLDQLIVFMQSSFMIHLGRLVWRHNAAILVVLLVAS